MARAQEPLKENIRGVDRLPSIVGDVHIGDKVQLIGNSSSDFEYLGYVCVLEVSNRGDRGESQIGLSHDNPRHYGHGNATSGEPLIVELATVQKYRIFKD